MASGTVDIGKAALPWIFGVIGGISVVVIGNIAYNYLKANNLTLGYQGRSFAGNIIRDAGSFPAYGPHSMNYQQKGYPMYGPQFGYPASAGSDISGDPFFKIGRNSQSEYQIPANHIGGAMPALSNIDRNYNRIFTDRY